LIKEEAEILEKKGTDFEEAKV